MVLVHAHDFLNVPRGAQLAGRSVIACEAGGSTGRTGLVGLQIVAVKADRADPIHASSAVGGASGTGEGGWILFRTRETGATVGVAGEIHHALPVHLHIASQAGVTGGGVAGGAGGQAHFLAGTRAIETVPIGTHLADRAVGTDFTAIGTSDALGVAEEETLHARQALGDVVRVALACAFAHALHTLAAAGQSIALVALQARGGVGGDAVHAPSLATLGAGAIDQNLAPGAARAD